MWATVAAAAVGIGLRWWDLGGPGLSGDEMYTGAYADLPVTDIPGWLANHDPHPPLDYLLRHPVAGERSAFLLRAPSAVFATLTVLLVWWWMRRRGWFGFAVILLTSLSSFELLYGRTARGYALLILCGTALAVIAERWLDDAGGRRVVAAAVVVTIALFTDTTALMLVLGAVVLPGRRVDRAAWLWRLGGVAPCLLWAMIWGPSTRQQYELGYTRWVPLISIDSALAELGRLVAVVHPVLAVVALPLSAFGLWVLWRRERRLAIAAIALSLVPILGAMLLGLRLHIWLARSMATSVWVVPVLLAGVIEWCRSKSRPFTVAGVFVVALVMLPSVWPAITFEEDVARTARTLQAVVQPGDAVVAGQERDTGHIFQWTFHTSLERQPLPRFDDPRVYTSYRPGAPFSGRVWVVSAREKPYLPPGLDRCPAPDPPGDEDLSVACWTVPGG